MPIKVNIHESFPKGHFRALGKIYASAGGKQFEGNADVLVKVVGKEVFLALDSDIHESKLMDRPVTHYNLATGIPIDGKLKIGQELEFKEILFNLK